MPTGHTHGPTGDPHPRTLSLSDVFDVLIWIGITQPGVAMGGEDHSASHALLPGAQRCQAFKRDPTARSLDQTSGHGELPQTLVRRGYEGRRV